jgi:protein-S-isoprenylcysteine O-methyltransferase Ste14
MTSQTRTSFFDIRLIIALLLGIYGLVLTILGLFFVSDEELRKSADVNINLWTGIAMLVVGALFLLWAWLRPLRVPVSEPSAESSVEPSAD